MSKAPGEYDLATLVKTMSPKLSPDVFVFLSLHENDAVPRSVIDTSIFIFREKEGRTFVLPRNLVETLGYQYEYPCKMITLEVHSSLAAVGFLAVILKHLAEYGISCNVASGFYHDHLFVTEGEEEKVVELLKMLSESVSESSDEEEADNYKNDDDEKRDDNDKKDDEISNKSDNEDDNIRNQADKMQNIVVISDSEDE